MLPSNQSHLHLFRLFLLLANQQKFLQPFNSFDSPLINLTMCQTCYDRGYKDYPNWVGSAPHPEYYQKGFNAHQAETGEAGHYAESVDFVKLVMTEDMRMG
jgi:hypothetical protein